MTKAASSLIAEPIATRVDRTALALAILRVTVGIIFLAHGYQKFFVYTIPGATGAFTEMGVPLASLVAPAVAATEFLGGLALILGFGTRIAAALLGLTMLGAIAFVHLKAGFFSPDGVEFPLTLLASAVALTLAGSGPYALDSLRQRNSGQQQ